MKANFAIFVITVLLALCSNLSAQLITLKKIDIDNKIQAPGVGELDGKIKGKYGDWVAFFARYDVKFDKVKETRFDSGRYIDDIEVKWEIVYKPEKLTANAIENYIKMVKTVKYTGVSEGEQTAVVLIHPRALKRYFNEGKTSFIRNLRLRFTMKVNGKTHKSMTTYLTNGRQNKKPTSQDAIYFDKEGAHEMDHLLLNRLETPFRYVQTSTLNPIVEDKK